MRFWEVLGNVKLAAIFITGARSFCDGRTRSPMMAFLGRNIGRLELEMHGPDGGLGDATDGLESIRADPVGARGGASLPELTSPFAQDAAQTLQMLLESLAAEWDSAAEQLRGDNETLARLLLSAREAHKVGVER